jgi:hypothetical protein
MQLMLSLARARSRARSLTFMLSRAHALALSLSLSLSKPMLCIWQFKCNEYIMLTAFVTRILLTKVYVRVGI